MVAALREEGTKLQRSLTDQLVAVAKAQSQAEFLTEKLEIATRSNEALKREQSTILETSSKYSTLLVQHQQQLRDANETIAATKRDLALSEHSAVHLRAENQLLKEADSRHQQLQISWQSERTKYAESVSSLQALLSEARIEASHTKTTLTEMLQTAQSTVYVSQPIYNNF